MTVQVTQDNDIEGDHEFDVSISSTSMTAVTVGSPASATVTISDDDGMSETL